MSARCRGEAPRSSGRMRRRSQPIIVTTTVSEPVGAPDFNESLPFLSHFSGTGSHVQSGSGSTVKQVGIDFGPSERLTVDFSNLDQSTLNIVIGQSGHLFSPHYKDQFPAWYEGSTRPLPFSDAAVTASAEHRLTLQPQ